MASDKNSYTSEYYLELQALIADMRPYETKKDLRRASLEVQKTYFKYQKLLQTDRRWKPSTTIAEFKKYRTTALIFKSLVLKKNLAKSKEFDQYDKYQASSKKAAIVTNALMAYNLGNGKLKLNDLNTESRLIHIAYKKQALRTVVLPKLTPANDLMWLANMPDDWYVNINGTSYNKTAFDFVYDYYNQSNDFAENLDPLVDLGEIYLYKRNG